VSCGSWSSGREGEQEARAISVRFSKGKLSFGGIDPAALPALVSALSGLKLPVS